jgi:hypothetical protein
MPNDKPLTLLEITSQILAILLVISNQQTTADNLQSTLITL